jgi:4-amino-4-deoxy-L-arabinose transferase-like glycosyltransferase
MPDAASPSEKDPGEPGRAETRRARWLGAVARGVRDLFEPVAREQEEDQRIRQRKALLVLAGLCLAFLVPFVGKAFNIDEPLFLWAARHILGHPFDPYGFSVNWYGYAMPMSAVMKNPPLGPYYIAVMAALFGWSEVALHLAFLPLGIGAVLGTYLVAARFCQRPFVAALCALCTPVFFVSSTTVMCDTMMLALWLHAIHLWTTGLERNSALRLLSAALLVGLCALTKYFGIMLIPLLLLYSAMKRRQFRWWVLYLLVPCAMLFCYQWMTDRLYGRGLLLDAAAYATVFRSHVGRWSPAALLIGTAFMGGCVAVVLFFTGLLWPRKLILAGLAAAAILVLATASGETLGNHLLPGSLGARLVLLSQFGLFVGGGFALLVMAALDLAQHRDAEAVLVFAWVAGTAVFAVLVNWTANGRSILPMVPAAGILLVRRLDGRGRLAPGTGWRRLWLATAGAAVLSVTVGWADYVFAGSARTAARYVQQLRIDKGRTLWFQGHWGFQYYLEQRGYPPVDVTRTKFAKGDIVVSPDNNTNTFTPAPGRLRQIYALNLQASRWITTMSLEAGAGFFAEVWGPLPFAFGKVPPERYDFFVVMVPSEADTP